MHRKKPSAEINVQALVVSFEEAGYPFEDDGGCLFALDSKVIVDAAAITAVSSVINNGIQQYNNFVEERLQKRTKPIKERTISEIFPDNPSQRLLVVFAALHCMPDKERGPARFFQARKPANITVIEQTG